MSCRSPAGDIRLSATLGVLDPPLPPDMVGGPSKAESDRKRSATKEDAGDLGRRRRVVHYLLSLFSGSIITDIICGDVYKCADRICGR